MAMSRDVFCGESPGTFIALRISRSEPRGRHRDPKARVCACVGMCLRLQFLRNSRDIKSHHSQPSRSESHSSDSDSDLEPAPDPDSECVPEPEYADSE